MSTFFAGKVVLVTGHTGFKGSWLVQLLKRLGARVVGLALPPEGQPNLFGAADVARGMVSQFGDIRVPETLFECFAAQKPEIVFHLAAQALVRRSYREPIDTFATNVMGTVHLLEACRRTPSVKAVVIVTSDKCYENREWVWGYRETDPMGGHDPYSASKGSAELVTAAYRRSFFGDFAVGVGSARAGNVIGGGDWGEDRLVPDIVRSFVARQPIVLRNPGAIRPWQHVLEPLSGYLLLAQKLVEQPSVYSQSWNFGPDEGEVVTVGALTEQLVDALGSSRLELVLKPSVEHETQSLRLDCSKARLKLGWAPRLTLSQTVQMTGSWYRSYFNDPSSAGAMLDQQIEEYLGGA
ncbi:MAG: CDP-glucose 4,6-dehydratase [Proteobacteria bacterium]|nr:CDP-glucose 4,6-dehydratase [Pseudomonadota bacterium]